MPTLGDVGEAGDVPDMLGIEPVYPPLGLVKTGIELELELTGGRPVDKLG